MKGTHQMSVCISPASQQEDNTVKAATEENALASNASERNRGTSQETVDFGENKVLVKRA